MIKLQNSYFAGLIDGEGYIAIHNSCVGQSKKYLKLVVRIGMIDPEGILKQAQKRWGGYLYNRKARTDRHRATIEWNISDKSAEQLLKDVYPYLIFKKKQAEIGLEFRKFVSYNNNIGPLVQQYRQLLADNLKKLHKSINTNFEFDLDLRKKALIEIKSKRGISEETRQKLIASHKGKIHAGTFKKGQIPWSKGRKFSEEHKRKIGKANKIALKKYYSGKIG